MTVSVPRAPASVFAHRNIHPDRGVVTRTMRNGRTGHRSGVVWLTGLSGAGKSTLANAVEHSLFERGWLVSVLDGDSVRAGLNSDLDFTTRSREENLRRAGEVAALFADAGHIVLASFVSPHHIGRQFVRQVLQNDFHLVYVKADVEECVKRDPKGLYRRAMEGGIEHFTGLGQSYEPPQDADLVIDTGQLEPALGARELERFIEARFGL